MLGNIPALFKEPNQLTGLTLTLPMITTFPMMKRAVVLFSVLTSSFAEMTDFNNLTPGESVNGQGGWTVVGPFNENAEQFDEEVVDLGSGNNAWRISNSHTSTQFSNQPYSSKSGEVAGETGAGLYNDYGTNGASPLSPPQSSSTATTPYFYGGFDFKSFTDSAQGSSESPMSIGISAGASLGATRMSYIGIIDEGTGFSLSFYETRKGSTSFFGYEIATGLSYDDWHHLEMYIVFVDGVSDSSGDPYLGSDPEEVYGNDIVSIYLDGVLINTGTTWESYYYTTSEGGFTPPTPQSVDSLLFRMNGNEDSNNDGGGFLFDNVETSNALIPEPSNGALIYGLLMFMLVWLRLRSKE